MKYIIYFIALILRFVYRFEHFGFERLESLRNQNRNFLLAIWHQNLLPGILAQRTHAFVVIVSRSKDAEPVAYTCEKLGHKVTRGSSRRAGVDKGGQMAKDEMVELLKQGYPGSVTVDGPKGPALKVKPGIIQMALESNSVLVPYTVRAKKYIQFKSWDEFQLPLPFTKIYIHYGDPIDPNSFKEDDKQIDQITQSLELEMLKNRDYISDCLKNDDSPN